MNPRCAFACFFLSVWCVKGCEVFLPDTTSTRCETNDDCVRKFGESYWCDTVDAFGFCQEITGYATFVFYFEAGCVDAGLGKITIDIRDVKEDVIIESGEWQCSISDDFSTENLKWGTWGVDIEGFCELNHEVAFTETHTFSIEHNGENQVWISPVIKEGGCSQETK